MILASFGLIAIGILVYAYGSYSKKWKEPLQQLSSRILK